MTTMTMLEDIVAQLGVTMKEVAEAQKKTERTLEEVAEAHAQAQKEVAEAQKEVAEAQRKTERTLDRVTKNIGGLNNSIGEIVEMIVIPGLKEKMGAFGHSFTIASPRREYSYPNGGGTLTEIDLLLENCDEVMAVEVKTNVALKWVNRHLTRLKLLRENQSITGMTGKTMYAAIAGINFDEDARELATENGMYIVEIEEEQERIKVTPPPEKIGTW